MNNEKNTLEVTKPEIGWMGLLAFIGALGASWVLGVPENWAWGASLIFFFLAMAMARNYYFGFCKSENKNTHYTTEDLATGIIASLVCAFLIVCFFLYIYPPAIWALIKFSPIIIAIKFIYLIIDYKNGFFYDLFFEFGKKINDKNFDCQFKNILLSNVVKFFYLPIMLDAADVLSTQLGKILLEGEFQNDWYNFLYALLYLIDVSIAVIGYTHASRPMNAHVRSVNPYPFGWVFALVCYAPFNIMIFQRDQFKPFSTPEWTNFIPLNSVFGIIYGAVVLILTAIYVWGTLSFDVRFSNLTNRGIIRSGPYRFMKHPSYWAKNISWWLIFLPFLAGESFSEKILLCLPCLVLNLVYVLRAYTEELHLAEDPDYRSYVEMLKSKRKLCR